MPEQFPGLDLGAGDYQPGGDDDILGLSKFTSKPSPKPYQPFGGPISQQPQSYSQPQSYEPAQNFSEPSYNVFSDDELDTYERAKKDYSYINNYASSANQIASKRKSNYDDFMKNKLTPFFESVGGFGDFDDDDELAASIDEMESGTLKTSQQEDGWLGASDEKIAAGESLKNFKLWSSPNGLRDQYRRLRAERDQYQGIADTYKNEKIKRLEQLTNIPLPAKQALDEALKSRGKSPGSTKKMNEMLDGMSWEQPVVGYDGEVQNLESVDPRARINPAIGYDGQGNQSSKAQKERVAAAMRGDVKGVLSRRKHIARERQLRDKGFFFSESGLLDGRPIGMSRRDVDLLDIEDMRKAGMTSFQGKPLDQAMADLGGEERLEMAKVMQSVYSTKSNYEDAQLKFLKAAGSPKADKLRDAMEAAREDMQKTIGLAASYGLDNELFEQAETTGWLSAMGNAVQRGALMSEMSNYTPDFLTNTLDADEMQKFIEIASEIEKLPTSSTMKRVKETKSDGFLDAMGNLLFDNPAAIPEMFVESLSSFLPSTIKWLLPSAAAGAAVGSVIPGAGTAAGAAIGARASWGVASFVLEASGMALEGMQELNIDWKNPKVFAAAWTNESIRSKIQKKMVQKGTPIAIADMLTGMMAGKVMGVVNHTGNAMFKGGKLLNKEAFNAANSAVPRFSLMQKTRNAAVELGADSTMGMGGEYLGQWASKEPGEDWDWDAIAAEGLVGVGPGAVGAALEMRGPRANYFGNAPIEITGETQTESGSMGTVNRAGYQANYQTFNDPESMMAHFEDVVPQGTNPEDQDRRAASMDFTRRWVDTMFKIRPEAMAGLKVVISDRTPDANLKNRGTFESRDGNNIIYLNEKEFAQDPMGAMLHESGHFARIMMLKDEELTKLWGGLKEGEQLDAYTQYYTKDYERSFEEHDEKTQKKIRRAFNKTDNEVLAEEWFSYQWARVLNSNYKPDKSVKGLEKFYSGLVRPLFAEFTGSEKAAGDKKGNEFMLDEQIRQFLEDGFTPSMQTEIDNAQAKRDALGALYQEGLPTQKEANRVGNARSKIPGQLQQKLKAMGLAPKKAAQVARTLNAMAGEKILSTDPSFYTRMERGSLKAAGADIEESDKKDKKAGKTEKQDTEQVDKTPEWVEEMNNPKEVDISKLEKSSKDKKKDSLRKAIRNVNKPGISEKEKLAARKEADAVKKSIDQEDEKVDQEIAFEARKAEMEALDKLIPSNERTAGLGWNREGTFDRLNFAVSKTKNKFASVARLDAEIDKAAKKLGLGASNGQIIAEVLNLKELLEIAPTTFIKEFENRLNPDQKKNRGREIEDAAAEAHEAIDGYKEDLRNRIKEVNKQIESLQKGLGTEAKTLQARMTDAIESVINPAAKKHLPKEQVKTKVATQFIGKGVKNSSTENYREMYASEGLANTGTYSSSDIIYVSSNGARSNRVNPVEDGNLQAEFKNIDKAVKADAAFIMDTYDHLVKTKNYNKGEIALANYIKSKGYKRVGRSGMWTKDGQAPSQKPKPASQKPEAGETTIQAELEVLQKKKALANRMLQLVAPEEIAIDWKDLPVANHFYRDEKGYQPMTLGVLANNSKQLNTRLFLKTSSGYRPAYTESRTGQEFLWDFISNFDVKKAPKEAGALGKYGSYSLKPKDYEMALEAVKASAMFTKQYEIGSKPMGKARYEKVGGQTPPRGYDRRSRQGFEVSSAANTDIGKAFSAFNAKLSDGESIEYHYQVNVKGYPSIQAGKGKPPKDTSIDSYGEYKKLWERFARENPKKIKALRKAAAGRVLTDVYATTEVNQARALYEILTKDSKEPTNEESAKGYPTGGYQSDKGGTLAAIVAERLRARLGKGGALSAAVSENIKEKDKLRLSAEPLSLSPTVEELIALKAANGRSLELLGDPSNSERDFNYLLASLSAYGPKDDDGVGGYAELEDYAKTAREEISNGTPVLQALLNIPSIVERKKFEKNVREADSKLSQSDSDDRKGRGNEIFITKGFDVPAEKDYSAVQVLDSKRGAEKVKETESHGEFTRGKIFETFDVLESFSKERTKKEVESFKKSRTSIQKSEDMPARPLIDTGAKADLLSSTDISAVDFAKWYLSEGPDTKRGKAKKSARDLTREQKRLRDLQDIPSSKDGAQLPGGLGEGFLPYVFVDFARAMYVKFGIKDAGDIYKRALAATEKSKFKWNYEKGVLAIDGKPNKESNPFANETERLTPEGMDILARPIVQAVLDAEGVDIYNQLDPREEAVLQRDTQMSESDMREDDADMRDDSGESEESFEQESEAVEVAQRRKDLEEALVSKPNAIRNRDKVSDSLLEEVYFSGSSTEIVRAAEKELVRRGVNIPYIVREDTTEMFERTLNSDAKILTSDADPNLAKATLLGRIAGDSELIKEFKEWAGGKKQSLSKGSLKMDLVDRADPLNQLNKLFLKGFEAVGLDSSSPLYKALNVYGKYYQFYGEGDNSVEQARLDYYEPMIELMREYNVDNEKIGTYLDNRAAPSRNLQIEVKALEALKEMEKDPEGPKSEKYKKIEKFFFNTTEDGKRTIKRDSGITTKQALETLEKMESDPKFVEFLNKFLPRYYLMNQDALNQLESTDMIQSGDKGSGIINEKEAMTKAMSRFDFKGGKADKYGNKYKSKVSALEDNYSYSPLQGFEGETENFYEQEAAWEEFGAGSNATGKGFDQKKSAFVLPPATGRDKSGRAGGPNPELTLANAFRQHATNMVLGHKNQVAQRFGLVYGMVNHIVNPDIVNPESRGTTEEAHFNPKILEEDSQIAQAYQELLKLKEPGNEAIFSNFKEEFNQIFDSNGFQPSEEVASYELIDDGKVGIVRREMNKTFKNDPTVFTYRRNGIPQFIQFTSKSEGLRMADTMKNLRYENLPQILQGFNTVTRGMAQMFTSANPAFILPNFFRDVATAAIHLGEDDKKVLIKDALNFKNLSGFMKEIYKVEQKIHKGINPNTKDKEIMNLLASGDPKKILASGNRQAMFQFFKQAGGKVGYFRHESLPEKIKQIQKDLKGKKGWTKKGWKGMWQTIDSMNTAVENSIRASTFWAAIKDGRSADEAAHISRNVTVDFNQKGNLTQTFGALYVFFGASVNSMHRFYRTLSRRTPLQRAALIGGMASASLIVNLFNRLMDDDEDEEIPDYDTISTYKRDTNFILPVPAGLPDFFNDEKDTGYFSLPLPLGYNLFWTMGQVMGDMVAKNVFNRGGMGFFGSATRVQESFLNAFNPVGGASLITAAFPTAVTPLVELYANKNFMNKPIRYADRPFEVPKPAHMQDPRSTPNHWTKLSRSINEFMGGSDDVKGSLAGMMGKNPLYYNSDEDIEFDISGNQMKHLLYGYLGGPGQIADTLFGGMFSAAKGDLSVKNIGDIPVANRFMRATTYGSATRNSFLNLRDATKNAEKVMKSAKILGAKAYTTAMNDNRKLLQLSSQISAFDKQKNKMRRLKKQIEGSKALSDEQKTQRVDELQKKELNLMVTVIKKAQALGIS